jgi:hypothetical protein
VNIGDDDSFLNTISFSASHPCNPLKIRALQDSPPPNTDLPITTWLIGDPSKALARPLL